MATPTQRDSHIDRAATNISIAYRNNAYIAEEVFPLVPVDKQSDVYFVFDKASWFRNRSGPRAPGTRAPRADYELSSSPYLCVNDSLAKEIPDEVRNNSDAPLRPDITAAEFVTDGLLLGLEKRVADLVTACANWASSSNPGTLWSTTTSDIWADIDTAVNAVVSLIGREPNVAIMGWPVWKAMRNHSDFIDRVKYTRQTGRVEPEDLRSWFGFEKVLIGKAVENTSLPGVAVSMSFIWGKHFWVGYVTNAPALEQPSAGYIFRWGNRTVERFRMDQEHMDVLAAEWHTDEVITASDAGAIFATAVA